MNHFDVITSKCWPDRHHCVGQVFLSLPNCRQLQAHIDNCLLFCCKFTTHCKAKGQLGSSGYLRIVCVLRVQVVLGNYCTYTNLVELWGISWAIFRPFPPCTYNPRQHSSMNIVLIKILQRHLDNTTGSYVCTGTVLQCKCLICNL